jgi:hypothetical protein
MNPEKFYKIFKQKINDVLEGDANSYPPRMQIIVEKWRLELTFYKVLTSVFWAGNSCLL